MDKIIRYKNGNMQISIFPNGTKIRYTQDDEFKPAFAESIDMKLTNQCFKACKQCHEKSCPTGEHGSIDTAFLSNLPYGMEVAIGGGCVFNHPQLEELLIKLKKQGVIASFTVHQDEFIDNYSTILHFSEQNLINGIGISLTDISDSFIEKVQSVPNAVLHIINGIINPQDMDKLSEYDDLKILILGYKQFGRGSDYYSEESTLIESNKLWMKSNIQRLYADNCFKVISFDNLALAQLDIQAMLPEKQWEEFYMGADGTHTFYVDLVSQMFARSSTSTKRYPIAELSIEEMFKIILSEVVD